MTMKRLIVVALVLGVLALAPHAWAQPQPVKKSAEVSETVTIEAIDYTARTVTFKDSAGTVETVYAPPEVKRFAELKVGDKVTFTYRESVAVAIHKATEKPTVTQGAAIARSQGPKPGATISQDQTAIVTIEAIDLNVPSVAVRTEDGRRLSFKVEDKKNLEGFKVGDKVAITYTQALVISVESPKK